MFRLLEFKLSFKFYFLGCLIDQKESEFSHTRKPEYDSMHT